MHKAYLTFIPLILFSVCTALAELTPASPFAPDSHIVQDWMLQDGRATPPDAAYIQAGIQRRAERLKTLKETFPKIIFVKHFDLGGSHYAYTEAQSDAQHERNFVAGSALCILELNADGEYEERVLFSDPNGVIRDPDISFDGKTIVFAWKKSDRLDDYHLYDYDVETGEIRQLTFGLGFADYEPCILPNGDIIFNSTRCVQIVDCWWTEVSNLYICDKDGRFLRRLSFDQVHTNFPTLLEDGRIIYTRWDYNDRGQIFPQGLFQMNPDGTGQTEFYGNNSWFPTTLMHSRGIPNSGGKVVSTFSGHHNLQYGKLGILDITKGRQENDGAQLIAPIRETTADRVDAWGQEGDRFAFPYPINEREFLVSYNSDPHGGHTLRTPFGIFWMDEDGQRELLAYDPAISSHRPMPLAPRVAPTIRPSIVNHDVDYGTFTMQDVYFGPGMEGIERGVAKTLRVIALEFRSTGIGENSSSGESGYAIVSTPISAGNGTWDIKTILGDTPIHEDGSASFYAPAKTPLYFQVLDEHGHSIQSMRSWSTLQPGEAFSCLGCHEDKNTVSIPSPVLAEALRRSPLPLEPFYGEPRGFSFTREIQPILDARCVECHQNPAKDPPYRGVAIRPLAGNWTRRATGQPLFQNLQDWHYTTQQPGDDWMQPEYFARVQDLPKAAGGIGSMPSGPLATPWNTPDIWVWNTIELPEDWQPQPLVLRYFHDEDTVIYVNGQKLFNVTGYNTNYQFALITANEAQAFKPGINHLAAHTHQTIGGQGVDFGIWTIRPDMRPSEPVASTEVAHLPFSLKGDPIRDAVAKRYWPQSYLNLTNSRLNRDGHYIAVQTPLVNWIDVQGAPPMLAPYAAGAATSGLMKMLDPNLAEDGKTHHDVKLTREELHKIAAWLDMLVPAFGCYTEGAAWNDADNRKFDYYESKKRAMEDFDLLNNQQYVAWLREGTLPPLPSDPNAYRSLPIGSKVADATGWRVNFDKPIRTDQVVIVFSADGPNAAFVEELSIECSNGFTQRLTLQKTGNVRRQVFTFPHQNDVTWLKLSDFASGQPVGAAIEVFGIEN